MSSPSFDTVRLQLGNGVMLCAVAPAKDPTTSNDTTAKFTGARHTLYLVERWRVVSVRRIRAWTYSSCSERAMSPRWTRRPTPTT
jgi:hypothetical protein